MKRIVVVILCALTCCGLWAADYKQDTGSGILYGYKSGTSLEAALKDAGVDTSNTISMEAVIHEASSTMEVTMLGQTYEAPLDSATMSQMKMVKVFLSMYPLIVMTDVPVGDARANCSAWNNSDGNLVMVYYFSLDSL
jgi:hypothetical protein